MRKQAMIFVLFFFFFFFFASSLCFRSATAQELVTVRASPDLKIERRLINQNQSTWEIVYDVKNTSGAEVSLHSTDVSVSVQGWLSNSMMAAHSLPRFSSLSARGLSGKSHCQLVDSSDFEQQCKESMTAAISLHGQKPTAAVTLLVPVDGILQIRIRLQHVHALYGDLDLLLGDRQCQVKLDALGSFSDSRLACIDHRLVVPVVAWPEAPDERRDPRFFISAPDSLHLEAHVSGHENFYYPDCPVRYATRYRLSFWYLVASGGEGEARFHLSQGKNTAQCLQMLPDGAIDGQLAVGQLAVGQWKKFERVFRTERTANQLQLSFKVTGAIGEVWIDNVALEALGAPSLKP